MNVHVRVTSVFSFKQFTFYCPPKAVDVSVRTFSLSQKQNMLRNQHQVATQDAVVISAGRDRMQTIRKSVVVMNVIQHVMLDLLSVFVVLVGRYGEPVLGTVFYRFEL